MYSTSMTTIERLEEIELAKDNAINKQNQLKNIIVELQVLKVSSKNGNNNNNNDAVANINGILKID